MFSLLVDDVAHLSQVRYTAVAAAGADLRKLGPPQTREDIVTGLLERMERPFDDAEAWEYDRDLWARKNVERMAAHEHDDPNRVYGPA